MMNNSELFDESTFYDKFIIDIENAKHKVIIESAFLTVRRTSALLPSIDSAISRNVGIIINTRFPTSRDKNMYQQALDSIALLQDAGCKVLLTVNHHRKLIIIDKMIVWEGSMNVLSQSDSCELMRRTESEVEARRILEFTKLNQWYS